MRPVDHGRVPGQADDGLQGRARLVRMEPVVEASGRVLNSTRTQGDSGGDILAGLREATVAGVCSSAGPRGQARMAAADRRTPRAGKPELRVAGAAAGADPAYLVAAGVREDMAGYLCAALIGATFEASMPRAAGTDADPVPYLVAAVGVLRVRALRASRLHSRFGVSTSRGYPIRNFRSDDE